MAQPSKNSTLDKFLHPSAGESERDSRYLAIRWKPDAAHEAKNALLTSAQVVLAVLEDSGKPPLTKINHTDGLWWVQSKDQKPISIERIAQLEGSALVIWVAAAFRSTKRGAGLFAVNPTRVYVKPAAVERAGGIAALGADLSIDSATTGQLRGYHTIKIDGASLAQGRTATQIGETIAAATRATGADLKFESIPFLSPTTSCGEDGGSRAALLPDCRPPISEFVPNDPMFPQQWGLARIGVPRAWEIVRGSAAITVAVIDEGVELTHPDLSVHPESWNASTDTPDGSPTGNHGTACAGIIGATFNNAQGVAGVAAGVRVMAIATATWADVDIAEGLYFAADHGARVVSMSFGVYASWGMWDFDLIRDALQYATDRGLVLIAASGNEDWNQSRFPGSDARTLCVGGSNRSDERKRGGDASSEPWWGASYGPDVDVVGPCIEIPTTDRLGGNGYNLAGDYYDRFNGTSSATPHVAGLAGLILSLNPALTNVDVRRIIENTCDKISPALYLYANVTSKPSGTWNEEVGYGRVNAERALLAACALRSERASDCTGCGVDCIEPTAEECRGPAPIPWISHDRCIFFYESRIFNEGNQDRRFQLRITYQHCLRLTGRQQGGLLYTTTLLPNEQVKLYEFDRFRRTKSETQRVSVHTSFRQTLSALSQARRSSSTSAYADFLSDIRTSSDVSLSTGGGLAGFLGAPQARGEFGVDTQTTLATGSSARTTLEQFSQMAITASQAIEAERSLVISTFEDEEHRSTTSRTISNMNRCLAVTYYVRRVNEVYQISTRVESIEWRLGDGAWRSVDDQEGLSDALHKLLNEIIRRAPRIGEQVRDPRQITLPTDGTLYEAELAHCSSCEPVREAEERIKLEQLRLEARKNCLEVELLALEVARRRALVSGAAAPLELKPWPFETDPVVGSDKEHQ